MGSLCIHLGALGDLVLALPALRVLRAAAPPLTLLAAPPQGALLARLGVVDRFVDGTRAALAPLFAGAWPEALDGSGVARAGDIGLCYRRPVTCGASAAEADAREAPLERVLEARGLIVTAAPARPAPGEPRHAADVLLAGARRALARAASPTPAHESADGGAPAIDGASALATDDIHALAADDAGALAVDGASALATDIGPPPALDNVTTPRLDPTPDALGRARDALAAARIAPADACLLHPGSGGARKRWPRERFIALACRLRSRGVAPLFVVGPVEEEREPDLRPALAGAGFPCFAPSLDDLVALAAIAPRYVGNDSGATHLVAAAGASTLALFGPTDPRQWGPRGPKPCRALSAPRGDLAHLDIASVESALDALLRAAPR